MTGKENENNLSGNEFSGPPHSSPRGEEFFSYNYALSLLSSLNHELRTPSSAITGYLHLLENAGLDSKQKKFIELIKKANDKINKIISGVSDFCEYSCGEVTLCKAKFDISNMLRQLSSSFEDSVRETGCSLCIPHPAAEPLPVYGDEYKLKQALSQILSTALAHSKNSGIVVALEKKIREDNEADFMFTISYEGIKMREDIAASLSHKTPSNLAIADDLIFKITYAKKIISAMGGVIEFNEKKSGGMFILTVPLSFCAAAEKESPLQAAGSAPHANSKLNELSGASFQILLVEDNFIGRKLIKNIIESIGWKIDIACDAFEGLKYFESRKYDLILLDIQLPDMNGYEFTKKIRNGEAESGSPETPIIAVTAYSLPSDREKCFAAGMNGYISKPISIENFYTTISEVLKNHLHKLSR